MSPITTHILDLSRGSPAEGVAVTLEQHQGGDWHLLGQRKTDADGRIRDLLGDDAELAAGVYRLTFDVAGYFQRQGRETFYPTVTLCFSVKNPSEHHHVPLLLSPFGYSTYRGS
ncbi:MAG: hydroxyisourate hydrolase [Polyangiaceae bacterium]|nr:hydroxyisourate hydrolase [Polyangiaceae bacterium]